MKLALKSAAVAALVAVSAPSFAAINQTFTDDAELVLMAWSQQAKASYIQDLGLSISQFFANGNKSTGYTFSQSVTSAFTSHTNLSLASDLKYLVVGFNAANGDLAPGQIHLLTTITAGSESLITGTIGDTLQNEGSFYNNFIGGVNSLPTHSTTANGANYATASDATANLGYLYSSTSGIGENLNVQSQVTQGNAVNTASKFFYITSGDEFDSGVAVVPTQFGNAAGAGHWNFDGQAITYTLNAEPVSSPVPEPGSYALMLAGLIAVGLLARRRTDR